MNSNKQEDKINLYKCANVFIDHKKEIGSIIVGCTLLLAGISFIIPVRYESTTLVQTRSAGKDISNAVSLANAMGISIGASSANDSPNNYIELMKTRHVLNPVIDSLEWEDENQKPSAGGFAKSNLEIQNTKKTNLITITGKGRTPEEAQKISKGVVDNFLILQTDMNQQTQSLLVKFLNERIEKSKADADKAAQKLADYSKEHKIYAPEDQAKMAIEKLNVYDKAISEVVVQQKASQAELESANSKIGQQKLAARNFNVNDNPTVVSIRSSIVEKQVELVELKEKFTDENPQLQQEKKILADLNRQLVDEVNAIVDSETATLNPLYSELLKNQAVAEAQNKSAAASEVALREKKNEIEDNLKDLPTAVMNYIQLESDAKLKQEVYLSLVKQCEQDKIREAMEAMDIQVIDEAEIPKNPSFPNTKIFAGLGFVLGVLLSICYIFFCSLREEKGVNPNIS